MSEQGLHRIDILPSGMQGMLYQLCTWLSRHGKCTSMVDDLQVLYLDTRQLKVTHVLFSSESADEALSQVEQKGGSKNLWMLSGKPREVEPPASKQNFKLSPVPLPKLGYIQVTVTEVEIICLFSSYSLLYCVR